MNKLRYRIVFNKARGMCMAVAETARSRGKGAAQSAGGPADGMAPATLRLPALRRLVVLLGVGLGSLSLGSVASAQVVADRTAPGQQRPTVLTTANGVIQVNVQTPSTAGVSHNTYSQFDVPQGGVVLNNSRTNTQSQLGGWVEANPWMTQGTAKVILNEVNSSNPSRLQGYVEVAGDRAETVIANPAGIVVSGGGFINVSRATLTTGTPRLQDGRLTGYAVQRGQIVIDGAGLDASKTDYTALIARAVQVNAGIWAQRLDVVAGVNDVNLSADSPAVQARQASDAAPLYAIDVAKLGGMYANQIYLVSTEAGVGVRNAGNIGAAAGDLVVTASGRLENTGTLSASQSLKAQATAVDNSGAIQATATLTLQADSLRNAGSIQSAAQTLLTVQGDIDNSGGAIEAPRIELTSVSLHNAGGTITQTGTSALNIDADQVMNAGGTLGRQAAQGAGDAGAGTATSQPSNTAGTGTADTNTGAGNGAGAGTASPASGTMPADGTAGVSPGTGTGAPQPILPDGLLKTGLADNSGGIITANGDLTLRTSSFDNRGGHANLNSLAVAGTAFDNSGGTLNVMRGLTVRTDTFVNDQGKLLVGAGFEAKVGQFSNRQGLVQAGQITAEVTGAMDNSDGTLRQLGDADAVLKVAGELGMEQGTLDVAAGLRLSAGSIGGSGSRVNVGGNLAVDSGATSTALGKWVAGGAATFHTAAFDNGGGTISSAGTLAVNAGTIANAGGTLAAGTDAAIIAAGTIDNTAGTIQAFGDLQLTATGAIGNHGGAIETLSSHSHLNVGASAIDSDGRIVNAGDGTTTINAVTVNNGGQLGGNGDVTIGAATMSNGVGARISAVGAMDLQVTGGLSNAGDIGAGGSLRMAQPGTRLDNHGTMSAQGPIEIDAAALDNGRGTIATTAGSNSTIVLNAGDLSNRGGTIQADAGAGIAVHGALDNAAGHIAAGGDLTLAAGDRIDNSNGTIESAGRLGLHGGEIGNAGGTISAAGNAASSIDADRTVDNGGKIGVNGALSLKASALNNGAGTVSATGNLDLALRDFLSNQGGAISSGGTLSADQGSATLINAGAITAADGTRLNFDRIDNSGGVIGTLQGAGLTLTTNGLANRSGQIIAGANLSLSVTGEADNAGGVLHAAGALDVRAGGAFGNGGGTVEALGAHAALMLGAASLDNTGGRIVNGGDGDTSVSVLGHIESTGQIAGNGRLDLAAATMHNTGTVSAVDRIEFAVTQALDNAGTISAGADLHVDQFNASLRNSGTIVAGGTLALTLASLENSGKLATAQGSNADVLLRAQSVGNHGGSIMADRNLDLAAEGAIDNASGLLQARAQLRLDAGGQLDTSIGDIETLSADSTLQLHAGSVANAGGHIVNAGSGDTAVRADTSLTNSGQIAANGALSVDAQAVTNGAGGSIASGGALDLRAHASLDNAGSIASRATLMMDEVGASLTNHGSIVANGEVAIRAGAIDNAGGTLATASGSGANLSVQAASLSNHGGQIVAERALTFGIDGALDNSGGTLHGVDAVQLSSGATLTNDGGTIEAVGAGAALALQANAIHNGDGRVTNAGTGDTTLVAAAGLESRGIVGGNGRLELHAATLDNESGATLASGAAMTLDIGAGMNNAGTVSSGAALDINAAGATVGNAGTVVAQGALTLQAGALNNDGGHLATAQGSGSDLRIDAASISNRGGAIQSDGDAQLVSGAGVDNAGGTLEAGGSLRVDAVGRVANNGGAIEALDANATLDLHAGSIDNGSGHVVNVGTGVTNITSDGALSSAGLVAGNGNLALRVGDLDNGLGGSITSGAALALTSAGGVANAGSIGSHDALTLDAAGSVRNSGQIAGASVSVDAAMFDNGGGQLASAQGGGGAIALHAGSVANVGGTIVGDGNASVVADGAFDNRGGTLHAKGALAVNADGALGNGGGVIEVVGNGATLDVQAASIDNSNGHLTNVGSGATHIAATGDIFNSGTLAGNGTVDVSAATLHNAAGATLSAGAALDLHASQTFENAGTASAAGTLTLDQAGAHIANSGDIAAGGAILLRGAAIDNDGGHIATQAGADLMLDSASTLSNRGKGSIAAAGNATLQAGSGYDNSNGQVQAQGRLQVSAGGALINNGGALEAVGAGSTLDVGAASIDNTAGRIVNAGNGLTSVGSASSIVNSGTLAANGALDISSLSLLNQTGGTIGAVGALDLAVRQQLSNAGGTISAGGTLHFDQAGASFANSGRIGAGAAIDIHAASIANDGGQLYTVNGSGGAINLQTGAMSNVGGTVAADGLLQDVVSGILANDRGTLHGGKGASIQVGGALANGSGTIETAAGALDVSAQSIASSGRIVNAGGGATTLTSQGSIVNSGSIAGNGALDVHAATLQNQGGAQIASGSALLLDVHQQLGNAGTITSGGTLRFEQAGASFSNSGTINAAGDAIFSAASFNNDGGHIATVAGSGAAIRVTAPSLSNHGGTIVADGDAVLAFANSADNSQGTLHAGHNLALSSSGAVSNGGGVIEAVGGVSALSVDGASIDNGNGRIANLGRGDTRLSSQAGIVNGGSIEAAGNLVLAGQTLQNNAGSTIASDGDMTLAVTQQLANQGKIDSGGALTFNQAGASFANSGQILAGGNVTINTRVLNNDGGQLGTGGDSGADLALSSDQLSNQGGRIATGRDLAMTTRSLTAMGELFGGRDLSLSMDGDFVQGSGGQLLHANRDLSLSVTGSITNTATFGAAGTLTLSGQQISNQAGATLQGGAVVLNAGGALANAGEIDANGALNISAGSVGNSGGIVGGNVSIATGNLDNSGAAALVGATGSLALGVDGTLNNTGGATLYSSGDMAIGGRNGGASDTVNNRSSTIEAGANLTLNATTLNNIRENVQIVQVKTVDETVHMTLPSWYQHGDNHNSYETSAANYDPHDIYFVKPSDILEDQVFVTPDGYTIHRAVIQTHANDSAFFVGASGLSTSYGAQQRLTLTDSTRVIYYTSSDTTANPDQGGSANGILSVASTVTHWTSTVSFSNQYGSCSTDCIRLITQPNYDDPRTTIIRDTVRAVAPVKDKLEVSRDAHHTAVEDQLAAGAGSVAQILAGGNMNLTIGSAINNQYADIKAQGILNIGGSAAINNVGATLYRTHNFDGTWRDASGDVVSYQQPSISEVIGSVAGVIQGGQGVSITGHSFNNVDVTAGTVGNIRDAVNVIGSGVGGAANAGAHATATTSGGGAANNTASASASGNHAGLAGMANAIGGASGPLTGLRASASGALNGQHAAGAVSGSGYSNGSVAGDAGAASGAANDLATLGMAETGAASGPAHLARSVAASANQTHIDGVHSASGAAAGQQTAAVQGAAIGGVVKVAASGLFLRNPDPNGSYVFETRPQFANQQQWTSSDYLLNQLALDPAVTQKRLGDGFYEQRMVREQLSELTGHTPDAGASDDSAYKQLLTNAVSAAKAFDLRPGVALSAEQVSQLTSDIVWMVSENVIFPDGSVDTVLVPQVYLAHVGPNAVKASGALVTGDGVSIAVTDSIANKGGTIDGGNGRTLLVAGQDIVNQGGTIKGGAVALAAGNDIRNESLTVKQTYDFGPNSGSNTSLSNVASIAATGTLDVMAGRDLSDLAGKISAGSASLSAGRDISFNTVQTGSTYQSQISGYTENDSTVTHQLSQISTGGDLKIAATGNLNLSGTQVAIGTNGAGTGQLLAGGTINIAAVTDEVKTSVMNDASSKQYDRQVHDNQTVVGAGVNAAGSLVLGAGLTGSGSINISGSAISAGDALVMRAAENVNISSVQENHLSDTASTRSSSSVFNSKATQQADYVASSDAVASSVSGKTVDINAGKDINVLGSAIVGDGDVSLAALGSVNIGAATSTLTEQHHTETKESGFLSGGGFGISYGTRTTTTDQQRDATTQSGQSRSMVGSLGGNLDIVAGDAIKVSGSDLAAGLDMNLSGRSVTIDPGQDNSNGQFEQKTVQDALTLAVGGSVVNALQTAQGMSGAASQSKDTRVQAMAAATAAMAAKDAAADYAKNDLSVSLSLTVGHSESDQKTITSETLHTGSTLAAGRDLTIVAKGDGSVGSGDINVVASEIKAGRDVALAAASQVNLLAAQDLQSQHSESKSMSAAAGVGVTYSTNGGGPVVGFTASVSASKGTQNGDGATQVNTTVSAGQTLSIVSGGDTNIKGAVASANQVVANVGGDLNIASLQDTAKFDSKNQRANVSGTFGLGGGASVDASLNQSTIKSDYASVQEQSGIKAGNGGFQLTVAGNTDLKGAVISSTEAGTTANSLTTRTLTQSEIENHATTQASSIGLSGSFASGGDGRKDGNADAQKQQGGTGQGTGGMNQAGANVASEKGGFSGAPSAIALSSNDKSTTASGISAGAITITSGATQSLAGLDRNVSTGTDRSGRLSNNFNAGETQTALEVTQQFAQTVGAAASPYAAKLVGDISGIKKLEAGADVAKYTQLAEAAAQNGDTALEASYNAQADAARMTEKAWGEDGAFRLALHAGAQGAIGGLTGGGAGAIGSAAGVVGGNLGKQLGEFLANAQADGLSDAQKQDLVNTYKQTMATIGGAVAGITAGSGTGTPQSVADALQGGTTAMNVDVNNRQLHEKESAWISANAQAFADQAGISPAEAAKRLAQQAAKDTDLIWRGLLPDVDDGAAESFLKTAANLTFTNSDGKEQAYFTTQGSQLFAPQNGALTADKSFYKQYLQPNASHDPLTGVAEEGLQLLQKAGSTIANDPRDVAMGVATGLKDTLVDIATHPIDAIEHKLTSIGSSTQTFGEGMAASIDSTVSVQMNDLYGRDVSGAVALTTALQGASVASQVGDVVGAAKLVSTAGKSIAEVAGKTALLDEVKGTGSALETAVSQAQADMSLPKFGATSEIPADAQSIRPLPGKAEELSDGLAKNPTEQGSSVKPTEPQPSHADSQLAGNTGKTTDAAGSGSTSDLSKPASEPTTSKEAANSAPAAAVPPPLPQPQPVNSLFGKEFSGSDLGHTQGLQNGVLGEQVGLQFLEEQTGMRFTPLQNGSGHGADGVFIDETTKTIYVAEVKSTQAAVDAAKDAQGNPLTKLTNWADKASNNASGWGTLSDESVQFAETISNKLRSGQYQIQGIEIKVSVPKPGTEGVTKLSINDWK